MSPFWKQNYNIVFFVKNFALPCSNFAITIYFHYKWRDSIIQKGMERIYNCWIRFGRNCVVEDKFLCYFLSCDQQLKITKFWKFSGENFRPTKYPRVKIVDPRNTHDRKLWTHEILTRKNLGPTKYPRENILNSRNAHEKNIQAHEIATMAQWHDRTRPKMAHDPQNLTYSAGCSLHPFHQVVWRSLWFCNFKVRSM